MFLVFKNDSFFMACRMIFVMLALQFDQMLCHLFLFLQLLCVPSVLRACFGFVFCCLRSCVA